MSRFTDPKLFVCYISGMDLRRIDPAWTPFTSKMFERYPWTRFLNLPSNELFPTLLTGADPTVHGVWGVKLGRSRPPSLTSRMVDLLPDGLTTTLQCCIHLLDNTYDLPAVPPRRRRRFEITRTKYKRRGHQPDALVRIGGVPSVLDLVGEGRGRYFFSSASDPVGRVLPRLCNGGHVVEILELYSLDRYQQWNSARAEAVCAFYRTVDNFLARLQERCAAVGMSLMVVSDHGHEPIREAIDLVAALRKLGLSDRDYSYFAEVSSVRFWFHDQRARQAITSYLSNLGKGTLVEWPQMAHYGIPLRDGSYGEVFYFLDPGRIFFPHDFHNPLANLWLGLIDPVQRSRLRSPRHSGNHGHLPHFAAEASFVALLDSEFELDGCEANILDVAPSMLAVLGIEQPPQMTGRALFRPRATSIPAMRRAGA
jgi:hypothetical protein